MKSILFFTLLFLSQFLSAQNFTEVPQSSPFDGVIFSSIAFADVDGDNDEDVLITGGNNWTAISQLYINNGMGEFTIANETPFPGVYNSSVAFSDVDGDGDQDVLITGSSFSGIDRVSRLYINDGVGNFTELMNTAFEKVGSSSIAFADVDGDSDEDVLISGWIGSSVVSKLYINDGMGNFSEVIDATFDGISQGSISFSDVDGDDDQDVLITGRNNSNTPISKLYINDGLGNFTEDIGTPFVAVMVSSIAFSDVDGDDDQDVLITGRNNSNVPISKLYSNDGLGNFTEVMDSPFEDLSESSVAFSDVDGDDDQDVLITGLNNSGASITQLYINDGLGNFLEATGTEFEPVVPFPMSATIL